MNVVGIFMWLAVGATALHYWHGYQSEHKYIHVSSERQVLIAIKTIDTITFSFLIFRLVSPWGHFASSLEQRTFWIQCSPSITLPEQNCSDFS